MTNKKTYPFAANKPIIPLAKGVQGRIRLMKDNEPNQTKKQGQDEPKSLLEEIIREGARTLLQAAIENEVSAYVDLFKEMKDDKGRCMVVRNGFLPERSILTGIGPMPVKQPRVRDKREDKETFTSAILPRYLRRIPSLDNLIPTLYLKGYPPVISLRPEAPSWGKMRKVSPQIRLSV